MNNRSFSRIQLAVIAIIVCALFVNIFWLFECIFFPERISEDISGEINRFITVRPLLPGRGIVGYISDDLTAEEIERAKEEIAGTKVTKEIARTKINEEISTIRIYIAQYALSPVILVRSLHYPLIVGNFRHSNPDLDIYRKQGLIPVRDFGNGVVLFKRESK